MTHGRAWNERKAAQFEEFLLLRGRICSHSSRLANTTPTLTVYANPDLLFLVLGGLNLGGCVGTLIKALIGHRELRDRGRCPRQDLNLHQET